jgi:uncharacterized protein DUF4252
MKKASFSLIVCLTTLVACAQSSHLDKVYQQYGVGFDPGMLLSASFRGTDDAAGNWLHRVSSVRCLVIDGKKSTQAKQEWVDLTASLRADHFEEWFSSRKGRQRFQLLSLDGKDNFTEFACVIVGDDDSGVFFDLRGRFTAADKARIEGALQSHDNE